MACQIAVAKFHPTVHPFSQGVPSRPGGKIFGSVCFVAKCEEGTPEVRLDEPISRFWSWARDKDIYDRSPQIVGPNGKGVGLVTIEAAEQANKNEVCIEFNGTSGANGKQSFDIKVKCRCANTDSWTSQSVDVSFTI
jgi:hypothetical protein